VSKLVLTLKRSIILLDRLLFIFTNLKGKYIYNVNGQFVSMLNFKSNVATMKLFFENKS